ncbi:hypothetical protein GCK72_016192 [Caenorhabditis remanei]|uniref:F-box domain-containing protein n=1 Tax=Caenorhabditis remanei TaxID=31234 RepID=A0A6A5GYT2_CAERE|nr:hypothetical protein GCK72_016192 [Caenorhabditis remanei]KAF1759725.1 hypothetical protein GCK72_016192 [Caenorhabditis remanei]
MPTLPILKLPILVLINILRTIDIETVFSISLCSRKMCYLVKNLRKKSVNLRLEIDGEKSSVEVVTPEGNFYQVKVVDGKYRHLESVNINGHLVPINRSRKQGWETYWDDKMEGMQSVMEYLSDLLGIKNVTTITVTPDTLKLLDVIKERQGNDYELGIYYQLSEQESHFILENHPAKVLRIRGFSHNFPIGKYLKSIDSLIVPTKLLITLDDLLNMNCVELALTGTFLIASQIKEILQHWSIGGLQRLKYLRLYVEDFNIEDVLGELTHTRMTEQKIYKSNVEYVTFSDRLITRNDGVVASLQYGEHFSKVQFGVWPDSEGNEYL